MKGLPTSNLEDMRSFARERPDRRIGQQSADQWPRFHIVTLAIKLSDAVIHEWYAGEAPDLLRRHERSSCRSGFPARLAGHVGLESPTYFLAGVIIGQRSTAQWPCFHIDTSLSGIEEIEAELSRDLGWEVQP